MKLFRSLSLFALGFLLLSCGGREQFGDLEQYINQLKREEARKQARKPQPPPIVLPHPALYGAKSLRSPFSPQEVISSVKKITSSNPLQAYSLNMLRFVGTIKKDQATLAYILTPDNTVYQVKEGDDIGDHGGKVMSITPDRLHIREEEMIKQGVTVQRLITLQLKGQ